MNLYQNEEVLPTFFQELPIIISQLGPENVFVSVYENNSDDKTQELLALRTLFPCLRLTHIGFLNDRVGA